MSSALNLASGFMLLSRGANWWRLHAPPTLFSLNIYTTISKLDLNLKN
jgi:hypothetical protein